MTQPLFELPNPTPYLWKESSVTSTPALPGNSVIDKMRASGMNDDQILAAAIMSFGQTQTQVQLQPTNPNDHVGFLRAQGYSDEQITAQIVAAASAANHAGNDDPTAAGGIVPNLSDVQGQLDTHAGTVQNLQAAHDKHALRLAGVEDDLNSHTDALRDHSSRLDKLAAALERQGNEIVGLLHPADEPQTDEPAKPEGDDAA